MNSKLIEQILLELDNKLTPDFFERVDVLNLVIIPQVHLVPYVYGLLLHEGCLIRHKTIIIHQTAYKMAYDIFIQFPNILQLDIRLTQFAEEVYLKSLIVRLKNSFVNIGTIVLHNFAGSINGYIAESLFGDTFSDTLTESTKILFYADGSRNNALPEISDQIPKGYHSLNSDSLLFHFGFIHHRTSKDAKNVNVLKYNYIETALQSIPGYTSINENTAFGGEQDTLILTRYWGREPYLFNDDVPIIATFIDSISRVIPPHKGRLIIRNDARFNIQLDTLMMQLAKHGYDPILFESFFRIEGDEPTKLLFENFLIDNPMLLKGIKSIYCFDSSFPLIFQNSLLYNYLPQKTDIYVGFDRSLVEARGLGECYHVMKQRTIETVISVISTNRFNVFSDSEIIYSPCFDKQLSIETISSKFDYGGGYFRFLKC